MKIQIIILCLLTATVTSACIHTKAIGIEPNARPLQNMPYDTVKKAEGVSSEFYLFWFIPVTKKMDKSRAMDHAINKESGDNLIGVTLYEGYKILPLGTVKTITAEGTVIKYR